MHTAPTTQTAPIRPKGLPPRPVGFCRECGHPYWPRRDDQEYCGPTCRSRYHKRRYERGAQLYDFAMEWRDKRLKGGFTKLCRIIDEWLREERDRRRTAKNIKDAYVKESINAHH